MPKRGENFLRSSYNQSDYKNVSTNLNCYDNGPHVNVPLAKFLLQNVHKVFCAYPREVKTS